MILNTIRSRPWVPPTTKFVVKVGGCHTDRRRLARGSIDRILAHIPARRFVAGATQCHQMSARAVAHAPMRFGIEIPLYWHGRAVIARRTSRLRCWPGICIRREAIIDRGDEITAPRQLQKVTQAGYVGFGCQTPSRRPCTNITTGAGPAGLIAEKYKSILRSIPSSA